MFIANYLQRSVPQCNSHFSLFWGQWPARWAPNKNMRRGNFSAPIPVWWHPEPMLWYESIKVLQSWLMNFGLSCVTSILDLSNNIICSRQRGLTFIYHLFQHINTHAWSHGLVFFSYDESVWRLRFESSRVHTLSAATWPFWVVSSLSVTDTCPVILLSPL